MRRTTSFLATASLVFASALRASSAFAQPIDARTMATAQALHDQGLKALDAKDYATACPKLEEVVRLVPDGLGARLSLAECYEGADRLASAWTVYSFVESAAARAHQIEREKKAHARVEAIKPRLAYLTLTVPASVRALPDLEIRGDGVVMGRAQWDVALPVDTGPHVFSATARGVAPWEKGVRLPDDGAHVTLFFDDPPAPAKPIEIVAPPAREVAKSEPPVSRTMRTAGLVVGAIGLVGIGVGSGAGIRAITARNASGDHCRADDSCDAAGLDLRAQSLTAGTWSTAMFVVGGVALAAGVTLVVIAPSSPSSPVVKAALGPGSLSLGGTF